MQVQIFIFFWIMIVVTEALFKDDPQKSLIVLHRVWQTDVFD